MKVLKREFYGPDDKVVSPNQTVEMIEKFKLYNSNLKYDLYKGVGHNSRNLAFSKELLNWILSHRKAE